MRYSTAVSLLFASVVVADVAHIPVTPNSPFRLSKKQDDFETCQGTCEECFGAGMIVCQSLGTVDTCFAPLQGEQCCADGKYCVGPDTSCCGEVGAGITGGLETSLPTVTGGLESTETGLLPEASSDTWDCFATDSNEECCQRGGDELHWCSGDFPTRYCYAPSLDEECCSNGESCAGTGCCEDAGAVATTPDAFAATSAPEVSATDIESDPFVSARPTTTRSVGVPGINDRPDPTPTGDDSDNTESTGNAAAHREIAGGAMVAAAGIFGLFML